MKMTEPYSPIARAKAIVKPVSNAGMTVGKMMRLKTQKRTAPSVSAASAKCRPILQVALHLEQRRLHRAHDERQADERERDDDADPRVCDLDPERREVLSEPTVLGEHRRQGDARNRGRQRERHIDQGVDELAT